MEDKEIGAMWSNRYPPPNKTHASYILLKALVSILRGQARMKRRGGNHREPSTGSWRNATCRKTSSIRWPTLE